MHQYTATTLIFGVLFLTRASVIAYLISCPPNDLPDAAPSLRHLCNTLEKVISDNAISDEPYYRRVADRDASLAERNVNPSVKRQDVDHVFLRFGRPYGL